MPFNFFKNWDDVSTKVDIKNVNEIFNQFFGKVENMGIYFQNIEFSIFEDYKPEYWNDAIRWCLGQSKKTLKILLPKKNTIKKDGKKKEKKSRKKKEKENKEKEEESENEEIDVPKIEG